MLITVLPPHCLTLPVVMVTKSWMYRNCLMCWSVHADFPALWINDHHTFFSIKFPLIDKSEIDNTTKHILGLFLNLDILWAVIYWSHHKLFKWKLVTTCLHVTLSRGMCARHVISDNSAVPARTSLQICDLSPAPSYTQMLHTAVKRIYRLAMEQDVIQI